MSSPTFRPIPAGSGSGDMTKAVYDTDDSGVVDDSTLWDGEALPAIADATGGQVLALKSDKSALEFASKQPLDATLTALAGVTTAAGKYPYFTGSDTAGVLDLPSGYNYIINPCFEIDQQAVGTYTAATTPANSDDTYLMDQWILLSDGNDIVDVSLDTSGVFAGCRTALKAEVETANKKFGFLQPFESVNSIPFRNQVISVSFKAKTASGKVINNIRCAVLEWTGTADAITSDAVSAWAAQGTNPTWATGWAALNTPVNLALTTSEQTFRVENISVGASTNNLAVFVWIDDTDAAIDDLLYLSAVKFEFGAVGTPCIVPRFAEELNKCMRFFQKSFPYSTSPADGTAGTRGITKYIVAYVSSFAPVLNTILPVPMRAAPTITAYNPHSVQTNKIYNATTDTHLPFLVETPTETKITGIVNNTAAAQGDELRVHWVANARL